jgi:transcriptional regulator with XRE-family HTH domain
MKLSDWLRQEGMTQAVFGERIGSDQANVSRWITGHHTPSLATLLKIMKVTKGAVTAEDFDPVETSQAAQ